MKESEHAESGQTEPVQTRSEQFEKIKSVRRIIEELKGQARRRGIEKKAIAICRTLGDYEEAKHFSPPDSDLPNSLFGQYSYSDGTRHIYCYFDCSRSFTDNSLHRLCNVSCLSSAFRVFESSFPITEKSTSIDYNNKKIFSSKNSEVLVYKPDDAWENALDELYEESLNSPRQDPKRVLIEQEFLEREKEKFKDERASFGL
ncbi:MAG: hypothetical protein V1659_00455 [Candidatus Woesearchaeota archaeon]